MQSQDPLTTPRARTCLGRGPTDSNSSIPYFDFSVFSVSWGICFSLKANPNDMKRSDSGTVLAQGTRLLRADASEAGALPCGFWHSWHTWHSITRLEKRLVMGLVQRAAAPPAHSGELLPISARPTLSMNSKLIRVQRIFFWFVVVRPFLDVFFDPKERQNALI